VEAGSVGTSTSTVARTRSIPACEKSCRAPQKVARFAQHPVLFPERHQLGVLFCRQPGRRAAFAAATGLDLDAHGVMICSVHEPASLVERSGPRAEKGGPIS
jgi:hypothetical protein